MRCRRSTPASTSAWTTSWTRRRRWSTRTVRTTTWTPPPTTCSAATTGRGRRSSSDRLSKPQQTGGPRTFAALLHNGSRKTIDGVGMPTASTDLASAMAGAWNAGEPERVIALAGQAMPSQQGDESVLLLLGLAQQATARLAQAAATFRQLAQQRPDVSAYWNNLAVVSRQAGDLAGAGQALHTALALAPDDAEVRYNLGLLYIEQQRWVDARQALLDAVALSPGFIEARLQGAYACHVCGDNTRQEALLQGAADWPAQPAEQALLLSAMLSAQGQPDAALHVLAQASLPAGPEAAAMRLRIAAQRVLLHERNNRVDAARDE